MNLPGKILPYSLAFTVFLCATLSVQAQATQTVYLALWRGCEDACQGFEEELAASGLDLEIERRDAGRDQDRLPGFVAEARALDADVVVTWGTSVTLALAGTLDEPDAPLRLGDRPVVFMIVSDPVGSRIVASYERTGRPNVTGTRNRVPEEVNIETIRAYTPTFRRLGLLYNPDEANSVLKRDELSRLAREMGFELVDRALALGPGGKPDPLSIAPGLEEIKRAGVDFLYFGSSSFLREHGDLFTREALERGLPLLSPYEKLVRDSQALISVAAPYREVGRLAAQQVVRILRDGTPAGDLPVVSLDRFAYVINMQTAKRLQLFPPIDFLQFAETVN